MASSSFSSKIKEFKGFGIDPLGAFYMRASAEILKIIVCVGRDHCFFIQWLPIFIHTAGFQAVDQVQFIWLIVEELSGFIC